MYYIDIFFKKEIFDAVFVGYICRCVQKLDLARKLVEEPDGHFLFNVRALQSAAKLME